MQRTFCTACGEPMLPAAKFCPRCGSSIDNVLQNSFDAALVGHSELAHRARYVCPNCNGENVMSLPVVAASGTINVSFDATTIGHSSIGFGIHSTAGSGRQQSHLSAAVAGPQPKSAKEGLALGLGCAGSIITVLVAIVSSEGTGSFWVLAGIIITALVAIVAYRAAQADAAVWNKNHYRISRLVWERSYLCLRCGTITDPFLRSS